MERDVFPIIGNRKIVEIAPTDILDMIRLVEARGALDIARRLKQNVSQVFRFAIANGWAPADPTLGLTDALKPKRSEEHTSELQSLMRISYAVFCLKKKKKLNKKNRTNTKNKTTYKIHRHHRTNNH